MGTYTKGVADFERHMRALVLAEFPSAFGGKCEVGHHLLRRLNHPSQVNDPRVIVPVTASQHAEFHTSPPTIVFLGFSLDRNNNIVGALFDYHGREYGWLNRRFVEAWNDLAPSK
jgi:hypothetical protein